MSSNKSGGFVDSLAVFKPNIFNGKVLFCTGGGSGICRAMTDSVMRHGADAVIIGRKLERITQAAKELSEATGRRCIFAQADVRNPAQLKAAVEKTITELGRIDFVICGAAGNFLAPISGLSENGFKTVIDIDTLGTYNTVKATLPHVRSAKGSYIHVSATMHYRGTAYQAHASAAKAAVDAMSSVLAIEEGPWGVRSNVIAPGPIGGTEGVDRLIPKEPDAQDIVRKSVPVGRFGDGKDIGNAAVYLFSDAASYVSGAVLVVDGGSHHIERMRFAYPESVLDPASVASKIKPRL